MKKKETYKDRFYSISLSTQKSTNYQSSKIGVSLILQTKKLLILSCLVAGFVATAFDYEKSPRSLKLDKVVKTKKVVPYEATCLIDKLPTRRNNDDDADEHKKYVCLFCSIYSKYQNTSSRQLTLGSNHLSNLTCLMYFLFY